MAGARPVSRIDRNAFFTGSRKKYTAGGRGSCRRLGRKALVFRALKGYGRLAPRMHYTRRQGKASLAGGFAARHEARQEKGSKNERISVWSVEFGGGVGRGGRDGVRNQELCTQPDGASGGSGQSIGQQNSGQQPADARCGRPGAGGDSSG